MERQLIFKVSDTMGREGRVTVLVSGQSEMVDLLTEDDVMEDFAEAVDNTLALGGVVERIFPAQTASDS